MSDFHPGEVAARVAGRIGLGRVEPRMLSRSEHVVLHLAPAPVVARVRRGGEAAMRRELEVANYLAERGAPVLAPLHGGVEVEDGWAMTFWPLVAHEPADEIHQELAGETLREVHRAFIDYPGELPLFGEKISACHALLMSEPPALAVEDLRFLLSVHEEIREVTGEHVPIHGDAGLHNLMLTPKGPLWTDFEAACLGPRAWDFAALGYGDDRMMALARSFCVSVWCWAKADLPGKREAAEYHLALLRHAFPAAF